MEHEMKKVKIFFPDTIVLSYERIKNDKFTTIWNSAWDDIVCVHNHLV